HARLLQAMDVTLAFGLLVLLSPVMLVVASLIALESRGASPLYGHRRYGKDGRTFLCYKFKSMAPDADARLARLLASDLAARLEWHRDHKLRDDPR
ncbi:sugar transferase, partial [Mycobacterium tuberculosis]